MIKLFAAVFVGGFAVLSKIKWLALVFLGGVASLIMLFVSRKQGAKQERSNQEWLTYKVSHLRSLEDLTTKQLSSWDKSQLLDEMEQKGDLRDQ